MILVLLGNSPALATLWWLNHASSAETFLCRLGANNQNYAIVVATYSFTMLGFVAGVMALFSLLGSSSIFKQYKERGYLQVLLGTIAVAMIELAICFWFAMSFFVGVSHFALIGSAISLVGSFFMVALCVTPVIVLQIHASHEKNDNAIT
jgi:hypothetical protein